MRWFWPATLLGAVTGCAQIFGLDTTSAPPDANLERASLQVQRVSVGATVQKNPQDLMGLKSTFYIDDGAGGLTPVPGEVGPMDVFSAPINMGNPPVQFQLPNGGTYYWALPARALKANFSVYEHPNPMPADPAAKIMLSAALPTPYVTGESFNLVAIGPWTSRALGAGDLPAADVGAMTIAPAAPLDYSSFNPMFGGMERPRITGSDYLLLLRYQNGKLTGVMQSQFEQTAGTDNVSGNLTPVNPGSTPVSFSIDPTGYSTRYSAVRPAPGGLAMSWAINAAPGWSILNQTGISLASGGAAMTDSMVTTSYGNPFESLMWKSVLVFATSTPRATPFMYMTNTVSLGAGMYRVQIEGTNSSSLAAPLPIAIRLNTTLLNVDGMSVALDLTKPVEIKADLDKTTAPTVYSVGLDEIQANGGRKRVVSATSTDTSKLTLPASFFEVGKTYVIQYQTYDGGYPNAAAGDLQNLELPFSTAYLDSGVFTVTP